MANGQPRAQFSKDQLGHMWASEGRESCQRERCKVRSERESSKTVWALQALVMSLDVFNVLESL